VKGELILDVGCGPAVETKYFTSKGYDVFGIDLSAGMLKEARTTAPKAKFMEMDMTNLDFESNQFDGIWCCASLLHVKRDKLKDTIKGFRRVLKDDGILFLSLKKGEGEGFRNYPDGTKRFFTYYSKEELEIAVNEKFDVIKSYEMGKDPEGDTWIIIFANPVK